MVRAVKGLLNTMNPQSEEEDPVNPDSPNLALKVFFRQACVARKSLLGVSLGGKQAQGDLGRDGKGITNPFSPEELWVHIHYPATAR